MLFLLGIVILLCLAGIVFVIIMGIDLYVDYQQKHIHMEKHGFSSYTVWEKNVLDCAEKWLRKMPTIRLTDSSRFVMLDMIKKRYKHSSLQAWQYAELLSGIVAVNSSVDGIVSYYQKNPIKELDDGYAVYLEWVSGVLKDDEVDLLMKDYLNIVDERTNSDGLIEYRQGYNEVYLVDTIAFVCPLLIKYGVYTGNKRFIDIALKQIDSYYMNAYLTQYGIYAHAYSKTKQTPCESIGWGRGTGWFLLGLLYCHRELPDNCEGKERLRTIMEEAASNIIQFQREDGGWCTDLISGRKYDSSATAIFAFFLCQMNKLLGEERYKDNIYKAIRKLMSVTTVQGVIDYCEGDCHGVGKYSNLYCYSPFVEGIALKIISSEEHGAV